MNTSINRSSRQIQNLFVCLLYWTSITKFTCFFSRNKLIIL